MNGTNIHMPSAFETVNRNATMEDNESARKDLSLPEMIEERDRIWDRIRALSGVLRSVRSCSSSYLQRRHSLNAG